MQAFDGGDVDRGGEDRRTRAPPALAAAVAALLVVLGRAADRAGRRRVYLTGVAVFALASAACAVAPSVGLLIAARTVQGAAAAAMIPAALGLLLATFPPRQWAPVIGMWGAVASVAAALGPPLGGLLSDDASWRWIFAINIPVGLLTVAVGARVLRESRVDAAEPLDLPGAGLLAAATGGVALVLVQGNEWGWTSAAGLGCVAGTVVLAGLLVVRIRRAAAPFGGRWASARGPRQPAIAGAVAFVAGLLWLVLAADESANFLGIWLPWGIVGGAGIGLGLPTLIGASAAGLPPTRFATGMALATHRAPARRGDRRGPSRGRPRHPARTRGRARRLPRRLRALRGGGPGQRRGRAAAREAA